MYSNVFKLIVEEDFRRPIFLDVICLKEIERRMTVKSTPCR